MGNEYKNNVLKRLKDKYGEVKKHAKSQSLNTIPSIDTMVYFRYSRLTQTNKKISAFYGLRKEDLDRMRGKKSYICFLTNDLHKSILIPYL